jgi:HlyD family secretion protein
MKPRTWIAGAAFASLVVAGTYFRINASTEQPALATAGVSRGDVVETVEATGTVQPVDLVEVGSQVTGSIQSLGADFNDRVEAGQVLARLDPASLQAQVDQAAATVTRLSAEVNRAQVTLTDAQSKLTRAEALSAQQLISQADLDAARATRDVAQAAVVSARAQLVQGRASLDQARVTLGHTIIRAPSAGVVLARNVEVGQTVTSGLQTPTLFVIARDLHQMQVQASVDEADIGRVAAGQPVSFTVDAHSGRRFEGRVAQVRLQPVVAQNVVSYTTMIDVANPDLALKPGMTATVRIETGRANDTLRVPMAAVRFRPSAELLQAMGHPANPTAGGRAERPGRARTSNAGDTRGAVWTLAAGRLVRVPVTIGISDGALVAVGSDRLAPDAIVVTGTAAPQTASAATPAGSGSPLVPTPPRRGRR